MMDGGWLEELERKIDLLLHKFEINFENLQGQSNLSGVKELAERGYKIEAIKLYRVQTGAELREAKEYVENFDVKMGIEQRINQKVNLLLHKFEIPVESYPVQSDQARLYEQVRGLLRMGNKIEAIKVYREATKTSLKEAKDVIDAMERELKGFR